MLWSLIVWDLCLSSQPGGQLVAPAGSAQAGQRCAGLVRHSLLPLHPTSGLPQIAEQAVGPPGLLSAGAGPDGG